MPEPGGIGPLIPAKALEAVRASGLVDPGDRGVILLSGGPDSVCLAAALAAFLEQSDRATAVHVNYGIRSDSDRDQSVCERLCDRLGIGLVVERPPERQGNLQDWARRARYAAAERVRAERGADWVAVGHTASDLAETVIYRLAVSPGLRPLLAMRARSGPVIRPLLALSRGEVRQAAESAGLEFVVDPSNDDPAYARARIRNEVVPVLRAINPGVETNISATRSELIEDDALLEQLAEAALDDALVVPGSGADSAMTDPVDPVLPVAALEDAHPALGRRMLRALAESTLDRPVPVSPALAGRLLRLGRAPEGGRVDLGGGATFVIEAGRVSVSAGPDGLPEETADAVSLDLPGAAEWQGWTVRAEDAEPPFDPAGPDLALIDRQSLGEVGSEGRGNGLAVRGWRQGDRIQPLGMTGTKSLQDLFTDAAVPRSRRRSLPVVLAGDEIVWVAGVAISHRFRIRPDTAAAVKITATPAGQGGID